MQETGHGVYCFGPLIGDQPLTAEHTCTCMYADGSLYGTCIIPVHLHMLCSSIYMYSSCARLTNRHVLFLPHLPSFPSLPHYDSLENKPQTVSTPTHETKKWRTTGIQVHVRVCMSAGSHPCDGNNHEHTTGIHCLVPTCPCDVARITKSRLCVHCRLQIL